MSLKASILAHIESFFDGLEAVILSFVHPLAASIAANGGKVLVDAALAAVAAAETTGGSGKDKLAAAVAHVIGVLETEGIPVVMNAVNGAIESAVSAIPKTVGASAAPAATAAVAAD